MSTAVSKREEAMRFHGRILFLTEDTNLIRRQLEATGAEAQALEDEHRDGFAAKRSGAESAGTIRRRSLAQLTV